MPTFQGLSAYLLLSKQHLSPNIGIEDGLNRGCVITSNLDKPESAHAPSRMCQEDIFLPLALREE